VLSEAIVRTSRHSFSDTVERLTAATVASGSTVFATIDQSAAATSVGSSLRPTTLLIFGNPKGGTPLMDAFPLSALDLPLKLLVWEANGTVEVAYTPAGVIAARYNVNGKDALIAALEHALETAVVAVA
jgi:uncharacterized protein (DUF302 family)